MELTTEELAEASKLKPAGKRFEKVQVRSGWLWLSNPTRAQWKRFQSSIAGDQAKAPEALEQVVVDCLVKPSAAELESWLDEWPGQLAGDADVGPALGRLAGSSVKA